MTVTLSLSPSLSLSLSLTQSLSLSLRLSLSLSLSLPPTLCLLRLGEIVRPDQAAPVSFDYSTALEQLGGDEDMLHNLLSSFVQHGKHAVNGLSAAKDLGDMVKLAQACHHM